MRPETEALKKLKKKDINKMVKKAIRPRVDKEKLLLSRQLEQTNKELYKLYKSKNFLIQLPNEKEALKLFLEIGTMLKRTKYTPSEYEVYHFVEAVHRAGVNVSDVEAELKKIDQLAPNAKERDKLKSKYLRALFGFYKTTGLTGKELAEYTSEEILRIKGKHTAGISTQIRKAEQKAQESMTKMGITDSELEQTIRKLERHGRSVKLGNIPSKIEQLQEINPLYADQAKRMISENLKTSLSSGRFSDETIKVLEKRLDAMIKEAKARKEKGY